MTGIVICIPLAWPMTYRDNKIGVCTGCGRSIQYRPHAPSKARKMCVGCVLPMLDATDQIGITKETVADLVAYFKSKSAN